MIYSRLSDPTFCRLFLCLCTKKPTFREKADFILFCNQKNIKGNRISLQILHLLACMGHISFVDILLPGKSLDRMLRMAFATQTISTIVNQKCNFSKFFIAPILFEVFN